MDTDTKQKIHDIEKRLAKLEDIVFGKTESQLIAMSGNTENMIVEKIEEINTQDLIVISLKFRHKQTKAEIKQTLTDWGKAFGNWFAGGNFGRLTKKGIIKKEAENDTGEDIFSLTKKGELLSEKLIETIRSL